MSKSACEENRKEGQQIRRCWIFARPVTELLKRCPVQPQTATTDGDYATRDCVGSPCNEETEAPLVR
jgi:hypothetical protein